MKYWWKNRNILPAAQCCPSKRVNECEDFPVSCYNKMLLNYPLTSTRPDSAGSVELTRINKLFSAGFSYLLCSSWSSSCGEVQIANFFHFFCGHFTSLMVMIKWYHCHVRHVCWPTLRLESWRASSVQTKKQRGLSHASEANQYLCVISCLLNPHTVKTKVMTVFLARLCGVLTSAWVEPLVPIKQSLTCKLTSFKGVGWQIAIRLNRTIMLVLCYYYNVRFYDNNSTTTSASFMWGNFLRGLTTCHRY